MIWAAQVQPARVAAQQGPPATMDQPARREITALPALPALPVQPGQVVWMVHPAYRVLRGHKDQVVLTDCPERRAPLVYKDQQVQQARRVTQAQRARKV